MKQWHHVAAPCVHKQFLIRSEEFYGQGEAAPAQVAQNDALHTQVHQLRWKNKAICTVSALNMQSRYFSIWCGKSAPKWTPLQGSKWLLGMGAWWCIYCILQVNCVVHCHDKPFWTFNCRIVDICWHADSMIAWSEAGFKVKEKQYSYSVFYT